MTDLSLIVRRVIRAPSTRVFRAWTTPEQLRAWWGPEGVECCEAQVDLRPGGSYRIGNQLPDGRVIWIWGQFSTVEAPTKLVYTWNTDTSADAERVTVRFEEHRDGCEVIVVHERIATEPLRVGHNAGWLGCLEGLKAHVELSLAQITDDLIDDLRGLTFAPPVTHVYNPLIYARPAWDQYCDKYGSGRRDVLLLGMNPGPWGMSQVGVPFGEINHVRDWLGIDAPVGKPANEHEKRRVTGFMCTRSEVSGRRLWSWAAATFGTPDAFFERFFVANYCPLAFMEASGRNRIPEKLPKAERVALFAACDRALRRTVDHFEPRYVVGVGKFAEKKAKQVLGDRDLIIGSVLHPSPASPKANRGWAEAAVVDFESLGIQLP